MAIEFNKIYNSDCELMLSRIDNNSIDFVVTSPPYEDWRTYKGFSWNFENIAKELYRVLKPGRCVVWVVADITKNFCESLVSFKQAIYFVEQCGFNLLDTMIYERDSGPPQYPGMKRYPHRWEYMFVLCKGKPIVYNPIKDVVNKHAGEIISKSTQRQIDGSLRKIEAYTVPEKGTRGNVWRYSTGNNKDSEEKIAYKHPARFPFKLALDQIVSWSNKEEIVLDPFGGSGTTIIAAQELGRKFITCDISIEYCDIIKERFKQRFNLDVEIVK